MVKRKIRRCPHCGTNLKKTIQYYKEAINYYDLYLLGDPFLTYEFSETVEGGASGFRCMQCGELLNLTEEEVLEILKGEV